MKLLFDLQEQRYCQYYLCTCRSK